MAKRLRAVRGLSYPDATGLPAVLKAGGLSKLSPEERAAVKFRRVEPGGWCDDLPEISRVALLAAGDVEEIESGVGVEKNAPRGVR